jgi:hypothetical protein
VDSQRVGQEDFWDWLQLLIVPIMLSLITVAFTWQQNERQQRIEGNRAKQAQKIENQRAEAERESLRSSAHRMRRCKPTSIRWVVSCSREICVNPKRTAT